MMVLAHYSLYYLVFSECILRTMNVLESCDTVHWTKPVLVELTVPGLKDPLRVMDGLGWEGGCLEGLEGVPP
jgi:hypothetical protein